VRATFVYNNSYRIVFEINKWVTKIWNLNCVSLGIFVCDA